MIFFPKARTQIGVQTTDTNTAGKIIGFDEIYVKAISATSGAANATVDTSGGMLYGHVHPQTQDRARSATAR